MLAGFLSSPAVHAQSDDAAVVVYHGGIDSVEVFDLTAAQPRAVTRLGERRILPASVGPARVSDLKILPDGSHLLGDVDGRGAAITDPTGQMLRYVLDEQQRLSGIDAVTVGAYFAPGEPSLLVTGDSTSSNVTIRDTSQESTVWFIQTRIATSRGEVAQVAVMPDNMIAMAINWPDVGVYGIRIRDTSGPVNEGIEISSGMHVETPPDAVIVPELDVLRDLMVLEDGRLLVTTRFAMVLLNADGTLDELLDIGAYPAISGQLASARALPSGLWAITTFEAGEWIQPHPNHRLHWYDPELDEVVASSPPLSRAPLRVEAAGGTGGTNTVGFDAGLDLIQQGDPTTIELVSLIVPPTANIGSFLSTRGIVQNTGVLPVGLSTLAIRGAPGSCTPSPAADVDLAVATSVAVNPGAQYSWLGDVFLDNSFALGTWCAFVQGRDQQNMLRSYGEPIEFEINPATSETGSTIDVTPLPFNTGPEDMGFDGGDAGDAGDVGPPDKGCCATMSAKARGPTLLPTLIALMLLGRRRRARAR